MMPESRSLEKWSTKRAQRQDCRTISTNNDEGISLAETIEVARKRTTTRQRLVVTVGDNRLNTI